MPHQHGVLGKLVKIGQNFVNRRRLRNVRVGYRSKLGYPLAYMLLRIDKSRKGFGDRSVNYLDGRQLYNFTCVCIDTGCFDVENSKRFANKPL